jgi:outer membrane protein TolC
LIARARAERPELRTAVATVAAARADIDLADAVGRPDLRLGVSYALERDVETAHIAMVSAAITLPTRNRNQGARAAARARLRGAAIERGRIGDEVEREVRVAYAAYVRAVAAVHGFDQDVNEHLTENLQLARDSLASGKLDYFQFNQVRRELFASRMAYLDAVAEAIAAQVALDRAIGAEVLP